MKTHLFILTTLLLLLSSCDKNKNFVDYLEAEQKEVTMQVGEETELRVGKFYPAKPDVYELRWRVRDNSLIELDSISGKVTAKAPGTAYIQIFIDNVLKGTCEIHINGVLDKNNDVYICGINNERPVYWKNGILHTLKTNADIRPTAIDVYNNDVYVVGRSNNEVICFKNGEQIFNTKQGSSTDYKISVDKNNYYISGFINEPIQRPTIWKNGERTNLLLENGTYANSIFVANNDVYLAGETVYCLERINEETVLPRTIAKYWKNGEEIYLTDSNNVAKARDIVVTGQNVHIVGWKLQNGTRTAKYWKNKQEVNLNNVGEWSDAYSIAVNKEDVYILGTEKKNDIYSTVYWKNGIKTQLEDENDYNENNNIQVAENEDVYIAIKDKNYYIKNGQKVYFARLLPDYPSVSAIKVVTKNQQNK